MKITKYLNAALIASIALSLSLGLASCSDDKDDDNTPTVTPTVKMVPVKIVTKTDDKDARYETQESEYVYNDKLQIERISNIMINAEFTNTYMNEYTYDSKGRLATSVYLDKNTDKEKASKSIYTYDEKAGTVSMQDEGNTNPNNVDSFTIDEQGYSAPYENGGKGEFNSWTEKLTFTTDKNRNTTELFRVYNSARKDYKGNDVTETVEYKSTCTYAQTYAPFVFSTTPKWALELEVESNVGFEGLNLPTKILSTDKTTIKEGDKVSKYATEAIVTYNVIESKDNYPTKITVTEVKKEEGEKDKTITTIINIDYKVVK